VDVQIQATVCGRDQVKFSAKLLVIVGKGGSFNIQGGNDSSETWLNNI